VSNTVLVEVSNRRSKLFELDGGLLLCKSFLFFKLREKSTLLHVLKDEINELRIIKKTIYFQYVLMVAKTLYFNLLKQLVNHKVAFDNFFTYLFYCIQRLSLNVKGLKNQSEFTLTERFLKLKIINANFRM
jgi:hypothetical protein